MTELTVERVPLTELRPHPQNPRNGDTDAIAESLSVNGQFKPIVVAKDGTVLAGNHTYAAALSLGWTEIQIVRLPVAPNSKAGKRVMLADNRTSDLGRYDEAQLLDTLQSSFGDDLLGTGYATDDVETLERLVAALGRGKLNPDDEWEGLPDYTPNDAMSAFRCTFHFKTVEDADAFFEFIDRPKQAINWWPVWDQDDAYQQVSGGVVMGDE